MFGDADGIIDCGTNIELFRALAAMNDTNDREQWFVYPECDLWHKSDSAKFKTLTVSWEEGLTNARPFFRKATSEEIVDHFKNQKS